MPISSLVSSSGSLILWLRVKNSMRVAFSCEPDVYKAVPNRDIFSIAVKVFVNLPTTYRSTTVTYAIIHKSTFEKYYNHTEN